MSGYLWKYYLEDDVENFRRVLETAGYTTRHKSYGGGQQTHIGLGIGSPASFGTSPTLVVKSRKDNDTFGRSGLTLTRADLNHRDSSGRTLLHLVASSASENAFDFANALLEHPLTDIYIQDSENAWTALHRAFYTGNLAIADSILRRDLQDALGHGSGTLHQLAGGLIKIKDKEGNGPLDVFEMTLEGDMSEAAHLRLNTGDSSDSDDDSMPGNVPDESKDRASRIPYLNLQGDEVFTFGSNQNVTLGFGDEDDRHNPERISLRRPDHLYFQAYEKYVSLINAPWNMGTSSADLKSKPVFVSDLPAVIRNKPIRIQDVQMAKLHSAVLTDDAESNLHMCGHGQGGRLGLGDEQTRFQFVCVDGGALAHKKIAAVALGQNHTIALSDQGEVYTWGSNVFGQLGYDLPSSARDEEVIQTSPRRIFGPLKREDIIGIAASRIHSVAYTGTALYTWGKNEGQLGIVHSESRSVKIQAAPRNVAASRFSSQIASVSAIDRATTVLLENHDVIVFSHYVYIKLDFPLHGFENFFLKTSFMTTKYDASPNRICKVISGGDTICAMSSSGQVYTVTVSEPPAVQDNEGSTTNPKIGARNALSAPIRAWSNKKAHLSARDIDVDQSGSIILVTKAGSVWRRVKRAKIKGATAASVGENRSKDYKYSRIPGLTRVTAVRASGSGAYAAIREDCQKTKTEIGLSSSSLVNDLWPLVPFQTLFPSDDHSPSFPKKDLIDLVLKSDDPNEDIRTVLEPRDTPILPYDLLLCSTTSDLEIPMHQFIVSARSKIVRTALEEMSLFEHFAIPDVLDIRKAEDGRIRLIFQGVDILTLFNLALYLYTDSLAPVWQARSKKQAMAFRYRQTRLELLKIAGKLEMSYLESVLKRIVLPASTLHNDMESAYADPAFFENADIVVQLADDEEAWVHGALICQRCPFFEGLFKGRTGGQWLSDRRTQVEGSGDAIRVDLSHIQSIIFQKVLRHIYAGTGTELFDDVVSDDLESFLDVVLDVMSAANELMLDRLSEICQKVVGEYVTTRNVCSLLNAIAPCSVITFKAKALEYICYNLEAVLQHGHLEELDEDLLIELDETARSLQVECSITSRTGRQEEHILQKYPDLQKRMDQERQAKIDSIVLFNKYGDIDIRAQASFRAGSFHEYNETPRTQQSTRRRSSNHGPMSPSPIATPTLKNKASVADLMFEMDNEDDDDREAPVSSFKEKIAAATSSPAADGARRPHAGTWEDSRPPMQPSSLPDQQHARSPVTPGRPWGATPLPSAKLGIKEIMEQASTGRTSTLSMGLSGSPSGPLKGSRLGSSAGKMSQKERKRQLLQGAKSEPITIAGPSSSPATLPSSPWQTVGLKPNNAAKPTSAISSPAQSGTSTPKPQLTMRQTIANPGPTIKEATVPALASPSNKPQQTRPLSSKSKRPDPTQVPGFAISDKPVPITSVRHVPIRERNVSADQRSLIDILSEQAIQKQEVKDFGAKRSLQEIQQEQEFQEWWDKESARVREEEDAAAGKSRAKAKSSAGRGGRRRGRGGGGVGREGERGGEKVELKEGKMIGMRSRNRGKGRDSAGRDQAI